MWSACPQALLGKPLNAFGPALRRHALDYARRDGLVADDEVFYAEQNARLVGVRGSDDAAADIEAAMGGG